MLNHLENFQKFEVEFHHCSNRTVFLQKDAEYRRTTNTKFKQIERLFKKFHFPFSEVSCSLALKLDFNDALGPGGYFSRPS